MTILPFRTEREVHDALPLVLEHLADGGLLGHPTETVYGVGSGVEETDIAAVSALKERGRPKPMLLLAEGLPMIEALGLRIEGAAGALAEAFWPGPITLVLPGGSPSLPRALRGPSGGIAVRWTSHAGMRPLLAARGGPITSTSANREGEATVTEAAALDRLFSEAATGRLLVLDGGRLPGAPSSTVVDCTGGAVRIVREGAVSRASISSVIGSDPS